MLKKLLIVVMLVGVISVNFDSNPLIENTDASQSSIKIDQKFRDDVYKQLLTYKKQFGVLYTGDKKQVSNQVKAVMDDIKLKDQYVYGLLTSWKASFKSSGNNIQVVFTIDFLSDKAKEDAVTKKVKSIAANLKKTAKSDFEKVKAVHDYIVLNSSYSSKTKGSQYIPYTLLTEKKGVCQAYSLLMYRLLKELNVDVRFVKGISNRQGHGWNMVKVNGAWYHVDSTWDDPSSQKSNQVSYQYFMKSSKQMQKTHKWDDPTLPKATSTKYQFYNIAVQAFTVKKEVYYKHANTKVTYKMNMLTGKTTKLTTAAFNKVSLQRK